MPTGAAVSSGVHAEPSIETAILELLANRAPSASICPSEVARRQWPSVRTGVDKWREKMPEVHAAALRLALAGRVQLTQNGEVVDPTTVRGARRLRRGPRFET